MSSFGTAQGYPVAKGERLRLDARYDNRYAHTRVMGIMITYLPPDKSVTGRCGADPTDVVHPDQPLGRLRAPRFRLHSVAIRRGKAREIAPPRGKRVSVR